MGSLRLKVSLLFNLRICYYRTKLCHINFHFTQFSKQFASDPLQLLVAMAQQHVAQLEQQQSLTLQEGLVQFCQGYMERKSKYLKRWKRSWFAVEPGIAVEPIFRYIVLYSISYIYNILLYVAFESE